MVANIEADVLIAMEPELVRRVARGGLLVLSGILQTRKDAVRAAYARAPSLRMLECPSKGEWAALVYRA